MPTASKKSTGKTTTKKTGGRSASARKTAAPAKRKTDKRTIAKKKQFFTDEIKLITAGVLGLLFFLSNFGVMGTVGGWISSVELGLFGIVGYVFPLLLLLAVLLYVYHRGSFLAQAKLCCALLMIPVLSALMHLLFGPETGMSPAEYYEAGASRTLCGGAVGGLIAGFLRSLAGTIGAYLFLIAALIICMVFVTERSFVSVARTGAERTAKAAREGQERAREAAAAYHERQLLRREEERLRREEERARRTIDFEAISFHEDGGEAFDGKMPDAQLPKEEVQSRLADAAELYADYGKQLIGEQPVMEDLPADDGTGHGEIREIRTLSGKEENPALSDADDGRYDTQVLPKPELYTGNLERVPDYNVDTVPFDEPPKEEPYRSYRFDGEGEAEAEAPAAKEKSAVSETDAFAEENFGGQSFGEFAEAEEAAEEPETGGFAGTFAGTEGEPEDTYTPPQAAGSAAAQETEMQAEEPGSVPQLFYDTESGVEPGVLPGFLDVLEAEEAGQEAELLPETAPAFRQSTSARTVTATGKELAGVSEEAALLLQKKLAGTAERIDTGDEQSRAALPAGGTREEKRAAAMTKEENRAVAAEIEKKAAQKRPYEFPPLSLLRQGPKTQGTDQSELRHTAMKLQQVLQTFGVGVKVTNVSMGPAVTRYELQPDIGVKVARITALADDIKLALAAEDIRIEAPIPGKSAVGIEVPNKQKATVYFRDIIDTEEFRGHSSRLAFAIGRDIGGQTVVGDIAKMPHLLIAGATGSGKSVGINTLIMSLIYKSSPEDVRLIMVDPKVVELSVYNGIPHLLIPVVTDPKKAAGALNWAVAEMMDRYKKFADTNVRDLKGYNQNIEYVRGRLSGTEQAEQIPEKLPQIVIIIDELADLMMVASKEVEDAIVRLTQLARAAGIHLVIATQRPSVNVITGLIKANVPSRIAFQTSSGVDSRTIIDMNGAEKLMGSGDMLYFPSGASKPSRLQGAFISDGEVQAVVNFLTRHGRAEYSDAIGSAMEQQSPDGGGQGAGSAASRRDEYFAEAGRMLAAARTGGKNGASIGMLQRRFRIGFNRAANLMEQLAEAGVVGPEEGTKPRRILMNEAEFEAFLTEQGR